MLNERKVRLMTRMAMYESKDGSEDLKISTYHKKDYTSFQTVITVLWITVGYVIAVAIGAITFLDILMENLNMVFLIALAVFIIAGYFVLVGAYGMTAARFYGKKYDEARKRMKLFYHDLMRLNKMYEREK